MPTISGRSLATSISARPNGAGLVRCPSAASDAIIAEVVRRGLLGSLTPLSIATVLAPPRQGPFFRLTRSSRRRAPRLQAAIRPSRPA